MAGEERTGRVASGQSAWARPSAERVRFVPPYEPPAHPPARRSGEEAHVAAGSSHGRLGELEGVYVISVAARLLRMHPQTLRKYERIGLVSPSRSMGMLRLYSNEDIARLRVIKHLVEDVRLNLAGVEMVLSMVERLMDIRRQFDALDSGNEVSSFMSKVQSVVEEILTALNAGPVTQRMTDSNRLGD